MIPTADQTTPAHLLKMALMTYAAVLIRADDVAECGGDDCTSCTSCDDMLTAAADVPQFLVDYLARQGYEIRRIDTVPDTPAELFGDQS